MNYVLSAFTVIALGSILFASSFSSQMTFADVLPPRIIKQNAFAELESLEVDNKKDQKRIEKAKKEIEKSLEDKLWDDDSSLTFLGKKAFSHEKKAIKELGKVKFVNVSGVMNSLVSADMILAQLAIDKIPTDTDDKKIDKNLKKAIKAMKKAQKNIDKNKLDKAIDHYKKAWKHAFMGDDTMVLDSEIWTDDLNNDGLFDYYAVVTQTGDSKKPIKIDYKIQDECVDLGPRDPDDVGGDTYDDVAMMMGVSTPDRNTWLIDDMIVWNDWFKKKNNDENQMVDLVYSPVRKMPKIQFLDGDLVIQDDKKKPSFEHLETISELGGQSGWMGEVYFDAPSGDYIVWNILPAGGSYGCDLLATAGVHVAVQ